MRRLFVFVFVATLLTAFGVTACSSDDDTSDSGAPAGVTLTGTVNDHGTVKVGDASKEIRVELNDVYFSPTYIKVPANAKLTLNLVNEGQMLHTFTSSALGVDERLDAGASKTVTVTAPASGFAAFHCKPHQGMGMQGAIVVS